MTNSNSLLLASVAGAALIAAGASGVAQLAPWSAGARAQTVSAPQAVQTQGSVNGFGDLIAQVSPAVVSVDVQMQAQNGLPSGHPALPSDPFGNGSRNGNGNQPPANRMTMAEGAGFFVSADGYIVTANHVVSDAKSVQIVMDDGTKYPAKVVGADQATDVAVLKVDASRTFTYVKFADQMPRVGDWVVAIGNPYGLGSTATAGIVSALARDIGDRTYDGYLQIDAPINEGNSGGPTFDIHGNVVGINDAIFTPSGGSVGIGFDVPADTAKLVAAELQKSGHVTRSWLGLQVQDVTPDLATGLGLSNASGALVAEPQSNGPGGKAGIIAGDVVVAVNGTPIKDGRGLAQAVSVLAPGTSVKLDIVHGAQSRSIDVTLEALPMQD